MWTKENGIVIAVGDLNIWLEIVRTEGQETKLERKEDWNIDRTMDKD